jgi:hypothetical protein
MLLAEGPYASHHSNGSAFHREVGKKLNPKESNAEAEFPVEGRFARCESKRVDPFTRLAEFTLSPLAALRTVRSGRANGLATVSL